MQIPMAEQLKALGDDFVAAAWAHAELERLHAALTKISDPLLLPVEGVGLTRALRTIEAMREVASEALARRANAAHGHAEPEKQT